MASSVLKVTALAIIAATLLAGCGVEGTAVVTSAALSDAPAIGSTPESEKREMVQAQVAAKRAAQLAAAAEAAAESARVAEAAEAARRVLPRASVQTAATPSQDFMGWVNATMAKYGVSPGPGSSFVVGNTGFCGGYMCTTTHRYGTTPFKSLTTVSPGAIGNEFALLHEIAHQHGVGFSDSGGECAADVWARTYAPGSIYC